MDWCKSVGTLPADHPFKPAKLASAKGTDFQGKFYFLGCYQWIRLLAVFFFNLSSKKLVLRILGVSRHYILLFNFTVVRAYIINKLRCVAILL